MYMYECVNVLCGLPIAHVLSSSSEGRNASDYKIKCHNEAWKETMGKSRHYYVSAFTKVMRRS